MKLTPNQALQKGIEAHKAGRVKEADQYYTAILKVQPKHPDANHNMGVLAVSVGKAQLALPFFKTALEANPTTAQFWLSYIDTLIKLNQIDKAEKLLKEAKKHWTKGDVIDLLEQKLFLSTEAAFRQEKLRETQSNILDEIKLQQALKLAERQAQDGSHVKAKRIYKEILRKFPKNKKAILGLKALSYQHSSKNSEGQDPPKNETEKLISSYKKDQFKKTLNQATKLLNKFPNSVVLYNIIGTTNQSLGKLVHAIEAYKKAISLKPNYVQAYNNLGIAYQKQGRLKDAISAYNEAISLKPDFTEAFYNMGNALQDIGKLGAAIEAYNRAILLRPNYAEAYANLSIALNEVIFNKPNRSLQNTITYLLDNKTYVRPKDIAKTAISLLKFEPILKKQLERKKVNESIQNLLEDISELNKLPLLIKLMGICPVPDLELEKLFTYLRRQILQNISFFNGLRHDLLRFQSALALQCFTNEYIYQQTKHEETALEALEKVVDLCFKNNQQPSSHIILVLASYKALNEYQWCGLLAANKEIKEVFVRQVEEPQKENDLKPKIFKLDRITDNVSSKVRDQYEANPYPRWVNLRLPLKPASISDVVEEFNLRLPKKKVSYIDKPNILIAGCGTGQQSIFTAARFKSSKVLAIDISLSSLAYAKRKTDDFGINNIDYMQADILDFDQVKQDFDIIECGGVLHHMANPLTGWKILTDHLKPSGLMRIGLYSELARDHIIKARREIDELYIGESEPEIKHFREILINSNENHHKLIKNSGDFYSLSSIKDLLFHVQEHRFTIPQINDCLDKLKLKFCGFQEGKIVSKFKQTHTHQDDPYDLGKWHKFEEANPQTFVGMYQFWCQKIS